ncbi:MAG: AI-2E family transporter [Chitinophagaceae bacterium]|nr:AI-2E family transporter [Chitinophagaceae bacterium]MCB9047582.1 AI-2E family transporter [Chitinophagales bacterium]
MRLLDTDNLKQIGLLSLIVIVGLGIFNQFTEFLPGVLAATTMYILMRHYYIELTEKRGWKKWLAATLFIVGSVVLFVIPVFFIFQAVVPKLNTLLGQTSQLQEVLQSLSDELKDAGMPFTMDATQIGKLVERISSEVPAVLGATANVLTNTVLAFFFLYFMLVQGREMEQAIQGFLPLKSSNVDDIWNSTRLVVYANAIGIPVLAASQGLVAVLGYKIFGVDSYVLLGMLTGVFSIVPVVGCAIVWVPVCAYLGSTGHTTAAIGLAIYSFIITGGIDNVLRFTILKKLGDVHPIVTTIGIIVGVPMFGFMGFIFGPLLVSYLLLLIKIYRVEFATEPTADN